MAQCKNILIVEDDEGIRETLRMILEAEDYQVFSAENGKQGLELLPRIPTPCLILLDLMMPVMDGWAFAEALNRDNALAVIPVVVVTAFSEKTDSLQKCDGIIKKPIDIELLLKTVENYCGEKAA